MKELDFGGFKFVWANGVYRTFGNAQLAKILIAKHFQEAGLTEAKEGGEVSLDDTIKSMKGVKAVLDDPDMLAIIDEVFDSSYEVEGDFDKGPKVSTLINAPMIEGSLLEEAAVTVTRSKIVNFLFAG